MRVSEIRVKQIRVNQGLGVPIKTFAVDLEIPFLKCVYHPTSN